MYSTQHSSSVNTLSALSERTFLEKLVCSKGNFFNNLSLQVSLSVSEDSVLCSYASYICVNASLGYRELCIIDMGWFCQCVEIDRKFIAGIGSFLAKRNKLFF